MKIYINTKKMRYILLLFVSTFAMSKPVHSGGHHHSVSHPPMGGHPIIPHHHHTPKTITH